MLRKIADNGAGSVTTTDYLDGFVYVNTTLSYFSTPEGRVVNNGGSLEVEYMLNDQQGNARVTFNGTGTGNSAKVIQENSFYGFGMVMPGSVVGTPPTPNKNLYNGGSEWQNDFSNLPDLMQTFFRNYDAVLGRWTGVDPDAEGSESLSVYQYAGNNPIMFNDPMGDIDPEFLESLYNSVSAGKNVRFTNEGNGLFVGTNGSAFFDRADYPDNTLLAGIFGGSGGGSGAAAGTGIRYGKTANGRPYIFYTTTIPWFDDKGQWQEFSAIGHTVYLDGANREGEEWYDNGSKGNYALGLVTEGMADLGKSGKIMKVGELGGRVTIGVGIALDSYGVYNYIKRGPNNPNSVSPGKATWNTGVAVQGYWNPPGAILYFGVDLFYKGGWNGAANDWRDYSEKHPEAESQFLLRSGSIMH